MVAAAAVVAAVAEPEQVSACRMAVSNRPGLDRPRAEEQLS